jgi:antitoxin component of MazEF toxin-antitoxin module
MSKSQLIPAAMAKAADQARQGAEVPIAVSNEAALVGTPAAFNRKR